MPSFFRTAPATTMRSSGSSSSPRRRAAVAMLVAGAVVVTGVLFGDPMSAQAATKYPSWSDVQAAHKSQASKAKEVTSIEKLLTNLKSDVEAKQKIAADRGVDLQKAQMAFDQQQSTVDKLQSQADEADKIAKASETRAGQLAAQLGRSGTTDISSDLIANPGKAGNLLYKLGAMNKLTEQANGIYADAVQARGTAQSLTDQAKVAAKALSNLAAKAEDALNLANAAEASAQASVDEQSANETRLTAQLTAIKKDTALTEAGYNKGEKIRQAKAAAAKKALAIAAAKASGASGAPNAQGWTRPAGGYITSGFGNRVDPYTGSYALHAGTDLGASCGSNIYAAHSGTVTYAGPYGGYGNFVLLDNGANISTGYGHIVDGGIHVSVGQTVSVGQVIAQVGSTGWSTGCHLHFETRVGGTAQNAVPFMAARGVNLS